MDCMLSMPAERRPQLRVGAHGGPCSRAFTPAAPTRADSSSARLP